jgi:hypothetical protein
MDMHPHFPRAQQQRLGVGPTSYAPPARAVVAGEEVDVAALAEAVCARYFREFPDEYQRGGRGVIDSCRHDNRWLFAWAADHLEGRVDMTQQVRWLARMLSVRDCPPDRLLRNLELAAEVVAERGPDEAAAALAAVIADAARSIPGAQPGAQQAAN